MMNSCRYLALVGVILCLSFFGCASRPDEQIKLAQDAMNQAIEQYADQYAPGEWKGAKELWDQGQAQLAQEQYAAATESFLRAKARFLKATEVATAERESMHKQVMDILANIDTRYAEFKKGVAPAAKKEFLAATADIDKRIADVNTLMTQGDYIQAKTLGQQALQAIEFNEKTIKK
jgi:hypothetical protein